MNGNSACKFSKGNSLDNDAEARTLPLWFRLAMPVPATLVMGA